MSLFNKNKKREPLVMWNEEAVDRMLPKTGQKVHRYGLFQGQLTIMEGKPIYKMTRFVSSTTSFAQARKRAVRLFSNKHINVVIIDLKMQAIVGNLWMLSSELVR